MANHRGGYMGRLLRVDLSAGRIAEESLPGEDTLRGYVGCWGLGLRYLYDMMPPGYAATDPENPLIFMTAPLTGLPLPGATNATIATKNFDTGYTVGRSHSHGSFGIMLKNAGYDGIIITGRSDRPVYLWVHNGNAQLHDAGHLWGRKDSHDTEGLIKEEVGNPKASVAAIGPAGENQVPGGMICNDMNHAFSHSGVGSIMGNKKLKAIAVFGKQPITAADPEKLSLMNKEWLRHMKLPGHFGWERIRTQLQRNDDYRHRLKDTGFPGRNFLVNQLEEFGIGLSEQKYTPRPCPRCPIGCPYDVEVVTGHHKGYVATPCAGGEGLEGAGSVLGVSDPGAIFHILDLYDRLGIECSMAGCTIAMAIEAYEKGLITQQDTDGLVLRWGDDRVIETLLRKMVNREGFGAVLARGVKGAAEAIGGDAPSFAVNIKGSSMNLHDWRIYWGLMLAHIVGSGASWHAGAADYFSPEPDAGYPERTGGWDHRVKPLEVKTTAILKAIHDCSGLCWFITWGCQDVLQLTADTLNAATGWDYTRDELLEVGERLAHLERAFNVRNGLRPEDDWDVPDRLVDAPLDGPGKGKAIKPYLVGMVKEYHRLMDWDGKTGKPWRAALQRVGLDDVARDLWG